MLIDPGAFNLARKAFTWRHRLPWGREAGLCKFDIVNGLLRKNGAKSYLEIATSETGHRFWRIQKKHLQVCHRLLYRCPEQYADGEAITFRSATESIESLLDPARKYDLVFVDPWHNFACSLPRYAGRAFPPE